MKNTPLVIIVFVFLGVCAFVGTRISGISTKFPIGISPQDNVPSIGKIAVLNACGIPGAANQMASVLRKNNFDVKNTENASSFNYPFTMVVSRSQDMRMAQQIAVLLRTDKVILMRTPESPYDVVVFAGPDYQERTP